MNSQEERYIHFVSSIDNLNHAWIILQEIKKCKSSPTPVYAHPIAKKRKINCWKQ
jgi:hypothetical protein